MKQKKMPKFMHMHANIWISNVQCRDFTELYDKYKM